MKQLLRLALCGPMLWPPHAKPSRPLLQTQNQSVWRLFYEQFNSKCQIWQVRRTGKLCGSAASEKAFTYTVCVSMSVCMYYMYIFFILFFTDKQRFYWIEKFTNIYDTSWKKQFILANKLNVHSEMWRDKRAFGKFACTHFTAVHSEIEMGMGRVIRRGTTDTCKAQQHEEHDLWSQATVETLLSGISFVRAWKVRFVSVLGRSVKTRPAPISTLKSHLTFCTLFPMFKGVYWFCQLCSFRFLKMVEQKALQVSEVSIPAADHHSPNLFYLTNNNNRKIPCVSKISEYFSPAHWWFLKSKNILTTSLPKIWVHILRADNHAFGRLRIQPCNLLNVKNKYLIIT